MLRAVRKMTPESKRLATVQSQILDKLTDKLSGSMMEVLCPNVIETFTDIVYQLMRLGCHRLNWDHSLYKKSIRVIVEYMIEWGKPSIFQYPSNFYKFSDFWRAVYIERHNTSSTGWGTHNDRRF
ncbi:unnamed protein product [Caenorhabditis nigoni]